MLPSEKDDEFDFNDPDVASKIIKAMCYFHLVQAITNKAEMLPNHKTDLLEALRAVRQLAGCPPDVFGRAWPAVRKSWLDRGWDDFTGYFENYWIEEFPGWNAGYLGTGTPRTNNGLEGS